MHVVALGLTVVALAVGGAEAQVNDGWQSGSTGRGTAQWKVAGRQVVYRGGADFGWAVKGPPIQDGFVEVRFRPVEGRNDQAGGVVWRWQNKDNYYIARANALENNVVAYRMIDGKRTDIKLVGGSGRSYGLQTTVTPRAWHTLRVDFKGSEFVVRFDRDVMTFTVRDESVRAAGRVGIWSKADSVTEFEEFLFGSTGG